MKFIRPSYKILSRDPVEVKIICDVATAQELMYYGPAKFTHFQKIIFDDDLRFIIPHWFNEETKQMLEQGKLQESEDVAEADLENAGALMYWWATTKRSEHLYKELIKIGWSPSQARSVLPGSLKTEITVTADPGWWQRFFANEQLQEIVVPLRNELTK